MVWSKFFKALILIRGTPGISIHGTNDTLIISGMFNIQMSGQDYNTYKSALIKIINGKNMFLQFSRRWFLLFLNVLSGGKN